MEIQNKDVRCILITDVFMGLSQFHQQHKCLLYLNYTQIGDSIKTIIDFPQKLLSMYVCKISIFNNVPKMFHNSINSTSLYFPYVYDKHGKKQSSYQNALAMEQSWYNISNHIIILIRLLVSFQRTSQSGFVRILHFVFEVLGILLQCACSTDSFD